VRRVARGGHSDPAPPPAGDGDAADAEARGADEAVGALGSDATAGTDGADDPGGPAGVREAADPDRAADHADGADIPGTQDTQDAQDAQDVPNAPGDASPAGDGPGDRAGTGPGDAEPGPDAGPARGWLGRVSARRAARIASVRREAEVAEAAAAARRAEAAARRAEAAQEAARLSSQERAERAVPLALRVSVGWSWRLLVVAAAVYVVVVAIGRIRTVVIPVVAGLLISALIVPIAHRLQRLGVPRLTSAFLALLTFFVLIGGAAVAVGFNAANELPKVIDQVSAGIDQVRDYLINGPLHLSQKQIDDLVDSIQHSLSQNRGKVLSGVITTASVLFEVLTTILVTLFATFFFVYDGAGIWDWIVTRFPATAEERVRGAGREAWATLTGYIRGTVFVAVVDSVGISIGLVAVGTPLVAPLALVTFFGGFIPIVGATVAGIAAILVTLVAKGVVPAIIVAGVVLAVQQIEGHLLQPLVMRRAVRLHPLAIVIALSAGGVLAGIPGAVVAVPTVAVINRVARYLASNGKAPPAPDG